MGDPTRLIRREATKIAEQVVAEAGTSSKWITGAAIPGAGLGNISDMYLHTTTGDVYQKTSATVWTYQMNIIGPEGPPGGGGGGGEP